MHVDESLFAGGARHSTEWLLAKHSVLFVVATTLLHDEIVKVLELLLMNFECLASISLVSKLLVESLHNFTQAFLESPIHLSKVGLRVKLVLHILHPLGELVSKLVQSIFKI